MKKSLESTRKYFASMRTGRASPGILDSITVEYYGTTVPLKQLANVSVPEPRQLMVQPYDKGSIADIEKAIMKSDLGIQPRTEGGVIRLPLPQLTEERRKELVKLAKKAAEEGKVSLRNIRRDGHEAAKGGVGGEKVSEDAKKQLEEKIQKLTDKYSKEIDDLTKNKEEEILTL